MSVAPPPVRPVSGGRHRAPEVAPTGSSGASTGPLGVSTISFAAAVTPAGRGGARHAAPSTPSLSRAARTAGVSLAALGALAAAGGVATQNLAADEPTSTGEARVPSLAAAELAVAPPAPKLPTPAAVTAPAVLPVAAPAASTPTTTSSASPTKKKPTSGSSSSSGSTSSADADSSDGEGSSLGAQALAAAKGKIGKPYVWGSTGPNSFDCSGLMVWSYKQAGKSLPRTSSAQSSYGQKVSMSDLQPGDLIFLYSPVSHVVMYAGNGQVIEAPTSGKNVRMNTLSKIKNNVVGARRVG